MFLGHLGIGFASKRLLPREPLAVLLTAPLLLDILWPVFISAGVESVRIDPGNTVVVPLDLHDYPYSHSLLMAAIWSGAVGLGFMLLRRDVRTALVLGGATFSHWVLDFVAHRPDLPLYPGSSQFVGLGLWNSLAGTLLVEGTLFAGGVAAYVAATRPRVPAGSWLLWSLVAALGGIYLASIFGPPAPNATAVVTSAFAVLLLLAWGQVADHRRVTRSRESAGGIAGSRPD